MDLPKDSSHTMQDLNARLRGFLEQVNRLQEANWHLEAQIADWGVRSTSHSHDWAQQEQTVSELRAQVSLIVGNHSDFEKALEIIHTCGKQRSIVCSCVTLMFLLRLYGNAHTMLSYISSRPYWLADNRNRCV